MYTWNWNGLVIEIFKSGESKPVAIVRSVYWANKLVSALNLRPDHERKLDDLAFDLNESQEKVIDLHDKLEIYENLAD